MSFVVKLVISAQGAQSHILRTVQQLLSLFYLHKTPPTVVPLNAEGPVAPAPPESLYPIANFSWAIGFIQGMIWMEIYNPILGQASD
jgi:hypothetical protein